MSDRVHFGIVAGETSGDILGVGLIDALRERYPEARFSGIGGAQMQRAGCESLAPIERLAVMGLVEPLGRLPELWAIKRRLERHFRDDRPALFIGLDAPDFNLRLAARLHRLGIATAHYVSPSVWAWRKRRIHGIARSIDLMLTLFPFETEIYRQHGVAVHCVGHPLADSISLGEQRCAARRELELAPDARVLALLPGSRTGEIRRMAPVFLAAASKAQQGHAELELLLPCADQAGRRIVEQLVAAGGFSGLRCKLLGESRLALAAADFAIVASGTATLEAMLLRCPMAVCYRLAPLTHALASRMVRVEHMAIPNLLAGKRLVAEYLQDEVNEANLLGEIENFLANTAPPEELLREFERQHRLLRRGASARAAAAIDELLRSRRRPGAAPLTS